MKDILESDEIFEAYARIDCCNWLIANQYRELQKSQSPIETIVDRTTGFADYKNLKIGEVIVELLDEVIECKKKIEADYSGDLIYLEGIKAIMENTKNKIAKLKK